jgi:hypothetical protein
MDVSRRLDLSDPIWRQGTEQSKHLKSGDLGGHSTEPRLPIKCFWDVCYKMRIQ